MTRYSPAWKWIGFAIALIGVGFEYWQMPGDMIALPDALLGPGLAAVGVVALLLRAFGTGRFFKVWMLIAATVPLTVLIRFVTDAVPHDAWPTELAIAAGLGLAASLIGVALGSLFLLRSSQRPK